MDGTQPKQRLITLPLALTVGGMLTLGTITTLAGFLTWPDLEDRDHSPPRPRVMQPALPQPLPLPQPEEITAEPLRAAAPRPAAGVPSLGPGATDAGVAGAAEAESVAQAADR